MKKTLLFAAVLCGMTSFAAEPVAVWNGDFNVTTKGNYTLSANGNTVAADGSSITIASSAGVKIDTTENLKTTGITVIYKVAKLPVDGTARALGFATKTKSDTWAGVFIDTDNKAKAVFDNNKWENGTGQNRGTGNEVSSSDEERLIAITHRSAISGQSVSNQGTSCYIKAGSGDYETAYSFSGLMSTGGDTYGVTIGGPRAAVSGVPAATGLEITGAVIFNEALSKDQIAAYKFPEPLKKVEPLMLVNFRNGTATGVQTSAVEGWTDETRHGEAAIPNGGTLTTNNLSFATSGGGGKLWSNNWLTPTANYANGSYADIFGVAHTTLVEEIKTSLCAPDLILSEDVYKTGFLNGGGNGQSATISGLTVGQKYLVYVGFGLKKGDSDGADQTHTFKIELSGYSTADSLQYVKVGASGDATTYTDYTVGNVLTASVNGLMLVRMNGITPNSSGNIAFTMPSGRSGLNFLAVAKVNESKPTSKTFDISGSVSYADLETEGLTSVTLNLTADATVTFTKAVSANLTFTGAYNLTVKGGQHLTWANITDSGVTGTRTYEISGSYTAADGLKNKIKADTTNATYVFKGTDNNGATLDFGTRAITSAIASHLVFEGGTGHSLTIGVNNGNTQLASGNTADTPFILVKGGTTLTVTTNWMTGYSLAFSSNSCIVRVNDGGTLKFNQGTTRVWYNGQLYLDPGATIDLSACGATSPDALGFNGGVLDAKQQIYVPATADGAEIGVVKITGRSLGLASDGTAGCGIFVGKNSRLEIEGFSNDSDKPAVSKYGEGELRISGNVAICNNTSKNFTIKAGLVTFNGTVSNSPVIVESGASLSGSGTISSTLTLQAGSSIVVDPENHLTASSSLTLANPINLICTPVHGMTVITPPSGFEGTGYKATLNGAANEYDLYLDGGALKLKYKTPPAFPEGFGDFVIEVANGKVGEISVDVSKLSLNDYEKDSGVSYKLDFGGDKIVAGARTDNIVTFNLATGDFFTEHVYRGDFVVEFPDGEVKKPITVYEGVRTPTWISSELIIRKQGTINDAQGETIKLEDEESILNHDPDYIDNCDSVYMVTLSASEAVDADTESVGDSQGGLRLVKVDENTVKLEYLYNDEGDNNTVKWGDQWPDGTKTGTVTLALNASVTVRVEFHYAKGEDGDTSYVKYSIGEDYATSVTSWATAKKVTEVFIADGTVLPDDLKGLFQLDSAVVVDIELKPGEGDTIDYTSVEAANAALETLKVGICDAVMSVLTTTEAQETYRKYFQLVVVPSTTLEGGFSVKTEFTTAAKTEIEKELEDELEKVAEAFNSVDGKAEIDAKPGLYYGVKRGETLEAMSVKEDLQMAGADGKVTITITKPDNSSKHFYRIIVSPTPSETK